MKEEAGAWRDICARTARCYSGKIINNNVKGSTTRLALEMAWYYEENPMTGLW